MLLLDHGYRFFGEPQAEAGLKRATCNVNVVCPEGDRWRDQIRSVARIITTEGSFQYGCTGNLVNNTAEDLKPYLLTAQHCVESADMAATLVAYWNYESPACDDVAGGSLSQNQSGSTFAASFELGDGSDFTLVELSSAPDPDWGITFSGWDATGADASSAIASGAARTQARPK